MKITESHRGGGCHSDVSSAISYTWLEEDTRYLTQWPKRFRGKFLINWIQQMTLTQSLLNKKWQNAVQTKITKRGKISTLTQSLLNKKWQNVIQTKITKRGKTSLTTRNSICSDQLDKTDKKGFSQVAK